MIPRYTRPEMARIWSPERRYRIWLDVELYAAEAMARQGEVPAPDLEALEKAFADYEFSAVDVARIEEIEKTVKHDVIAFLTFLEEKDEKGGRAARHLHKGMTSSDVLDTTLAVQVKESTALLLAGIDRVQAAVRRRAQEHRRTSMMGRSHGIHAEPITFGLKLAAWYDAWTRRRASLALRASSWVARSFGPSACIALYRNTRAVSGYFRLWVALAMPSWLPCCIAGVMPSGSAPWSCRLRLACPNPCTSVWMRSCTSRAASCSAARASAASCS